MCWTHIQEIARKSTPEVQSGMFKRASYYVQMERHKGHFPRIHKLSQTVEHNIWRGILQRCYNPKRKKYAIYGARGIVVCKEWLLPDGVGFLNFLADMGERPGSGYSVERKDNNGNYCKENCRWATKKEQARNRTTSRIVEFKGEKKSLAEWCELRNMNYSAVQARLNAGWDPERALTIPIKQIKSK